MNIPKVLFSPIHLEIRVVFVHQELLQDAHHLPRLGEEENSVPLFVPQLQDGLQDMHFPRATPPAILELRLSQERTNISIEISEHIKITSMAYTSYGKRKYERKWLLMLPVAQRRIHHHNYEVLRFADLGGYISFEEQSSQQRPVIT